MTDTVETGSKPAVVQITGNASAPFVYFDVASAHGVEGGSIVIIELVARTIVAIGGVEIRNEIIATGHLRTNIQGAQSLRQAVDDVMLMLTPVQKPEGPAN